MVHVSRSTKDGKHMALCCIIYMVNTMLFTLNLFYRAVLNTDRCQQPARGDVRSVAGVRSFSKTPDFTGYVDLF